MRNSIILAILLATTAAVVGCAWGESYAAADFDVSRMNRIAVLPITGQRMSEAEREAVADYFSMEFMMRGYQIIERSRVREVMAEQRFRAENAAEQDVARIGEMLGADGVVMINVSGWGGDIAITTRLVDVDSASVLWIGAGEGSMKRGLTTVVGTVFGAGLGILIGRRASYSGGVAGGVVGGVAGGATGALLEPHQARAVRRVIAKVCESLPDVTCPSRAS